MSDHRPTLKDVATRASVSVATASRALVLSTPQTETQRRVHQAAAEVGYTAQRRVTHKADTIALITTNLADPVSASITQGVLAAASREHSLTTVDFWGAADELDMPTIQSVATSSVRSLILIGSVPGDPEAHASMREELALLQDAGTRVVAVGPRVEGVNVVELDIRAKFAELTCTLLQRGIERVAVLAGARRLKSTAECISGVREGLKDAALDLDPAAVLHGQPTRSGGYSMAGELLSRSNQFQAVVASNDRIALGAVARLREAGRVIGDDVAVTGFGGTGALRMLSPALSCIEYPWGRVGDEALRLAVAPARKKPMTVTISGTVRTA